MTSIERFEFGNLDHIKFVKNLEREAILKEYLDEHKHELIDENWKEHTHECEECGQDVVCSGMENPNIKIRINHSDYFVLRLSCAENRGCDHYVDVKVFKPESEKIDKAEARLL